MLYKRSFGATPFCMLLAVLLTTGLAACEPGEDPPDPDEMSLEEQADEVVRAIAARNWSRLADHVHPEHGLLFSPSATVDPERDPVFTREEVASFGSAPNPHVWGEFDGSGERIRLTVDEYVEQFLYTYNFIEGERGGPNEEIGSSNTINNLPEVMGPDAVYIEYHVPPEEEHGMDWGSLRVVFEETEEGRYLIGLVRDQWTI